jgi:hypothetical protein
LAEVHELPRGTQRCVGNNEHQMLAVFSKVLCEIIPVLMWSNPTLRQKYGSRADFFEAIAEALVNPQINWAERGALRDNSGNGKQLDCTTNPSPYITMNFLTETCTPVPIRSLNVPLSTKIKVCQICHYEMWQYKWKSVAMCSKHGVHLCTDHRRITSKF